MYLCEDCKLLDSLPHDVHYEYWTVRNGMKLTMHDGVTVPFYSDIVPCGIHRAKLEAEFYAD